MRHLISLFDVSQQELQAILSLGEQVKSLLRTGRRPAWMPRSILALLFEKPSLRTRVSFEAGISQLGGTAMFLGQDVGWQNRESTADFVRVLAQYADYVVCRAKSHASVLELASYNVVPIINGLTDVAHPCQALADLMTMRATAGSLAGRTITFVGDGNNVARSLALACAMVGMRFRLLGPEEYFMPECAVEQISQRYPNADIKMSGDARTALQDADFVYTDVWTSMGQEAESAKRVKDFSPYQLNATMMGHASGNCKVLHCLPARRGEEITDEVMDHPNSVVVEQAGNRMHAQKGLLIWLALQHQQLTAAELATEGVQLPPEIA
ncbi:MAG: ornithine carbamoyltransferase [Pirellulaceae bacterium]